MAAKIVMIFILVLVLLCPIVFITLVGLSSWGVHDYDFALMIFFVAFVLFILFSTLVYRVIKKTE